MSGTALMPVDPAMSSQQISRLLSIRANLLPAEIIASRTARRLRVVVIVALALVAVLLGGWYAHAIIDKGNADQQLSEVSAEVSAVRAGQNRFHDVVTVKQQNETIAKNLTGLMAKDLPWARLTDTIRDTGNKAGITVTGITGALTDGTNAVTVLPNATAATTVATLQITGTSPDKKTIAKYVELLGTLRGVTNPYLGSATQTNAVGPPSTTIITFSLAAEVTSTAQCGRFTTPTCANGGK